MQSKINELIQTFEERRQKFLEDVYIEYDRLKETYDFNIERGKIYFSKKARKENKAYKKPLWKSFLSLRL